MGAPLKYIWESYRASVEEDLCYFRSAYLQGGYVCIAAGSKLREVTIDLQDSHLERELSKFDVRELGGEVVEFDNKEFYLHLVPVRFAEPDKVADTLRIDITFPRGTVVV